MNLQPILWIIAGAALAALGASWLTARRGRRAVVAAVASALLIGALIAILWVSLAEGPRQSGVGVNLIPFRGILDQLSNVNTGLGLLNIMGNVVMYLPIGLLVPLAVRRRWITGLAAGAAMSVTIETLQLLTGRGAMDIDDVILNVTGAALGAAIAAGAQRIPPLLRRPERVAA